MVNGRDWTVNVTDTLSIAIAAALDIALRRQRSMKCQSFGMLASVISAEISVATGRSLPLSSPEVLSFDVK
jgi:hypothetical protein